MQSPLRSLSRASRFLERDYANKLDAQGNKYIKSIIYQAKRMYRLIEDLLTYASVDFQSNAVEKTDCQAVMRRVLNDLAHTIEKSHATITHDPLPTVKADDEQLTQLFHNLIENAIRYCRDAPREVHIGVRREADEWVFTVRDNGIGIDPDYPELGPIQSLQPGDNLVRDRSRRVPLENLLHLPTEVSIEDTVGTRLGFAAVCWEVD